MKEMKVMPVGWARASLGEVANFEMGQAPPGSASNFSGQGTVFVKAGEFGKDYPVVREWTTAPLKYAKIGDVLICVVGATAGKLNLGIDCAIGRSVAAIRPQDAVLQKTLYRQLQARVGAMRAESTGSAQGVISKEMLADLSIAIPPLREQERIADKLDTVLARLDACRDRLADVAPLLKRFRQSVLAAATSGRLTKDWRSNQDANWPTEPAADVCAKVQSGGTPKAGFTEAAGVPFLKVYNIVNQQIDFEYRPQFVHPDIHAGELRKSQALPGDVLMNIVGPPLGKVAVLTDAAPEWNINQAITLFRPSDRITSGWLYILLCEGAAVRSVLERTKGSVGQVNISLSQCRAFEFPVPTIKEQNEVVRRVKGLFAFADRLEARLAQAQTAIDRLTPSLLAKAFRGELVPQDPEDEPAAELLKRLAGQRAAAPSKGRKARQSQPA